jgi:hypothetical protein
MLIDNKRQLYKRQYGHGIGDVIRSVMNNQYAQKGFKGLYKGGKYLLKNIISNLFHNPEKVAKVFNPERLKRQIPKIIEKVGNTTSNFIQNRDAKQLTENAKDITNTFLYGEGVKRYKSKLRKYIHYK